MVVSGKVPSSARFGFSNLKRSDFAARPQTAATRRERTPLSDSSLAGSAAGRSAAFFAASVGHASLFFYAAIIALCSERRAVTFNGLARRVFFSLL